MATERGDCFAGDGVGRGVCQGRVKKRRLVEGESALTKHDGYQRSQPSTEAMAGEGNGRVGRCAGLDLQIVIRCLFELGGQVARCQREVSREVTGNILGVGAGEGDDDFIWIGNVLKRHSFESV